MWCIGRMPEWGRNTQTLKLLIVFISVDARYFLSLLLRQSPVNIQCLTNISQVTRVVSLQWYDGKNGFLEEDAPTLVICYDNGRVQMMTNETDDSGEHKKTRERKNGYKPCLNLPNYYRPDPAGHLDDGRRMPVEPRRDHLGHRGDHDRVWRGALRRGDQRVKRGPVLQSSGGPPAHSQG